MPSIICPNCARQFYLDAFTYWNYLGDVRCTVCGATLTVAIWNGILQGTPINRTLTIQKIPNAPENVSNDISEAQICHAVGAHKSCVVMCRRSLEQVCDRSIEIFEEIRYFGNYGAHPSNDLLGDVSGQDSSSVLELALHMIKHLYDIPEKIRSLRSRRI